MLYNIAVIRGDGIGPEVIDEAVRVLEAIGARFGHQFHFTPALMGGCALDAVGVPLPDETMEICFRSDAVLLGAVGGPKWDTLPSHLRPEQGLLGIRAGLKLYANLRPAVLYEPLRTASPLRPEIIGHGFDLMLVRELTGGLYFGAKGRSETGDCAYDTEIYTQNEVERIGRVAFSLARQRRKKLCSIDKANVMESSRFWREIMHGLSKEYPDVAYSDMLADNAAMQLVRDPGQFDVMVASNIFGDILSDEAGMCAGSLGLLPSASLGDGTLGLYEPVHGSAPDLAGRNMANPLAAILSAGMLLRHSLKLEAEAAAVEAAVRQVLDEGYRTADIATDGCIRLDTAAMGQAIAAHIS